MFMKILKFLPIIVGILFLSIYLFATENSVLNKIHPWVLEHTRKGEEIEFLVLMKERADLSPAYGIHDVNKRRRFVYETLLRTAHTSQNALRAWLTSRGIAYRWFYTTNALLVKGDIRLIIEIARREDVARIVGNPVIRNELPEPEGELKPVEPLAIEWNITKTRAPEVWNLGYYGQGIVVGGQDTGYRWTHEALKNQYRGWDGTTANHDYNWHDSIHPPATGGICGADSPVPCDDQGHGTHTMGTVLGRNYDPNNGEDCTSTATNEVGMAPCARWIGCRNMDQGNGTPARYIECFDFFLAPYPVGGNPNQGDPTKAPDLTTNSWGCPPSEGCSWDALQQSVDAHHAAGIMFIAAAGNSGPSCNTVSDPPAMYQNTYTVGSTTSTDDMSSFSSRGPGSYTNLTKPNIVAPGSSVRSSTNSSDTAYTTSSGTSMATPNVAGAVALLWSARPDLKNNPDATAQLLNQTARRLTSIVESCGGDYVNGPNNTWGYGLLDVYEAVIACQTPSAPTNLTASVPGDNIIHLTWTGVSGATEYRIYRSTTSGGPYSLIGSVPDPTTSYDDTTVSGGTTYYYVVRTFKGCESVDSNEASATATGLCTLAPSFQGVQSATSNNESPCGITLSWNSASLNCGSQVAYNIYRSTNPNFSPSQTNLIASCVQTTTYTDKDNLLDGTTYYYIVRSEDDTGNGTGPCRNGNEDTNTIKKSATPSGPVSFPVDEAFTAGIPAGWTIVNGGACGDTWTDTNPGNRNPGPPFDTAFVIADSDAAGSTCGVMDEELHTPAFSTIGYSKVVLEWSNQFRVYTGSLNEMADVDVSTDGGTSWTNVHQMSGTSDGYPDPTTKSIDISAQASSSSSVKVRFHYYNADWEYWWAIDNVKVQLASTCTSLASPKPVPDGYRVNGNPVRVMKEAGSSSTLPVSWDVSRCSSPNYNILYGFGSGISSYTVSGGTCSIGTTGTYTWTTPAFPQGEVLLWWFIVGTNGAGDEGSWGYDSSGNEVSTVPSNLCGSNSILLYGVCQ